MALLMLVVAYVVLLPGVYAGEPGAEMWLQGALAGVGSALLVACHIVGWRRAAGLRRGVEPGEAEEERRVGRERREGAWLHAFAALGWLLVPREVQGVAWMEAGLTLVGYSGAAMGALLLAMYLGTAYGRAEAARAASWVAVAFACVLLLFAGVFGMMAVSPSGIGEVRLVRFTFPATRANLLTVVGVLVALASTILVTVRVVMSEPERV